MKHVTIIIVVMGIVGVCRADISGVWNGALTFNGIKCVDTPIEIKKVNDALTVRALSSPYAAIGCSKSGWTGYFGLSADFRVSGSDLWRYNAYQSMGTLTNNQLVAQDRECNLNGSCTYWDNLNFSETSDGKLNVWISYHNGDILEGQLTSAIYQIGADQ